jgi:pimeloyl-ACP methyl ester carboxylesterase
MDRRGRGGSGDAEAYELEREAEDVAAIVEFIGGQVNVLGHSHGGLCALEAARQTAKLRRLMLYESVPLRGAQDLAPGVVERLEAALAAGDVERVLIGLLRDIVEMPEREIAQLRCDPRAWQVRLANARTIPRELRVYERYLFEPARFGEMRTPTLLFVGGDSPSRELASATRVAEALPSARVAVLEGQQHLAMYTSPESFVNEVVGFLNE